MERLRLWTNRALWQVLFRQGFQPQLDRRAGLSMSEQLVAISPGATGWNEWLAYHNGTKIHDKMLAAVAAVTRRRAQWLQALLAEIFSSDIPTADVAITERPDGSGAIAIRGVELHTFTLKATWLVPSVLPPSRLRRDRVTRREAAPASSLPAAGERRSAADGELDAVAARVSVRQERSEKESDVARRRRKSQARAEKVLESALDAAAQNNYPDVEAAEDLGLVLVSDPDEAIELELVGSGPPMTRRKTTPLRHRVVSLREDVVGRMAKRGQLGMDETERDLRLRAARHYEATYARAEIGGARGINPMQDKVDGGRFATPDTDARLAAQARLRTLDAALGHYGVAIVRAILVAKWDVGKLADTHGESGEQGARYYGRRFKECLDCIAAVTGIKQRARPAVGHHDEHAHMARAADSLELHRAIQAARSGR